MKKIILLIISLFLIGCSAEIIDETVELVPDEDLIESGENLIDKIEIEEPEVVEEPLL